MQADKCQLNRPPRKQPSPRITWALALIVPVLAAVALFFWLNLTGFAEPSSEFCGPNSLTSGLGVCVLLLAGPGATVWHGRHARPLVRRILCPAVLSTITSVMLASVTDQVWWLYQGCYL